MDTLQQSNGQQYKQTEFTPFKFMDIQNMLLVFSFFSPFIVIFFFTFIGMYFSELTGFIFLASILISLLFRYGIYNNNLTKTLKEDTQICHLINYSNIGTGDVYLSLWVFSFTLFYIIVPLIGNNGIQRNLMLFLSIFLILFFIDIGTKFKNGCYAFDIIKIINIAMNIIIGGFLGMSMSMGYSTSEWLKNHLFFAQKNSSETCRKTDDTQFECTFDFE